jgi:hypothetical protein
VHRLLERYHRDLVVLMGRAFLSLWARFILTRYLPVYLYFYLRGPG